MTESSYRITKLANRGAKRARDQAKKHGVPVAYSLNGKIVKQYPDGRIKSV
jgi:hypothetical protein